MNTSPITFFLISSVDLEDESESFDKANYELNYNLTDKSRALFCDLKAAYDFMIDDMINLEDFNGFPISNTKFQIAKAIVPYEYVMSKTFSGYVDIPDQNHIVEVYNYEFDKELSRHKIVKTMYAAIGVDE